MPNATEITTNGTDSRKPFKVSLFVVWILANGLSKADHSAVPCPFLGVAVVVAAVAVAVAVIVYNRVLCFAFALFKNSHIKKLGELKVAVSEA